MKVQVTCWECDLDHAHDIPAAQAGLEVDTTCPKCHSINIVEAPQEDEAPEIEPVPSSEELACRDMMARIEQDLALARRHIRELEALLPALERRAATC